MHFWLEVARLYGRVVARRSVLGAQIRSPGLVACSHRLREALTARVGAGKAAQVAGHAAVAGHEERHRLVIAAGIAPPGIAARGVVR